MKSFQDEDFLLHNPTAHMLYHEYASVMPVIDFHCHLSPDLIATDHHFENITQAWLQGDHYKWRAMRTNGVDESYCTGNKSDEEKFLQWAATVPYTWRNPLFHWTHLELRRYFGISEMLGPSNAKRVYEHCSRLLREPAYSVQGLLRKMRVEIVCTTDDPADSLDAHRKLAAAGFATRVLPSFRPDSAMAVEDMPSFNAYVHHLEAASNTSITSFEDYLAVLKKRHDFFASCGCRVSDHGLSHLYGEDYTETEPGNAFEKIRSGRALTSEEIAVFKSALLYEMAIWDAEKGWVQQFHLGALRNNNTRMMRKLGPDTGWDSIGDFSQARALAKFLDRLDREEKLAKTIIYNLNPADNEVIASMVGNFNDGSVPGKIQFGSAWWFLDQKDGMVKQINTLSNMGLLSRFVGMLTDSRSFLSYPRHEYFRRILCDLIGQEMENGELPDDIPWAGKIISDICYHNARNYFNF